MVDGQNKKFKFFFTDKIFVTLVGRAKPFGRAGTGSNLTAACNPFFNHYCQFK